MPESHGDVSGNRPLNELLGYAAIRCVCVCVRPCWADMQALMACRLFSIKLGRRNVCSSFKCTRKPTIRAGLFRTMLWYLASQQCLFRCHEQVDTIDIYRQHSSKFSLSPRRWCPTLHAHVVWNLFRTRSEVRASQVELIPR